MELRIENRGTYEAPYGYVYHGEARSWFMIDRQIGEINIGGPSSGYWRDLEKADKVAALVLLSKEFGQKEGS